MKYIIYGANRVAKDFLYIFDQLNIVCFVDDSFDLDKFMDYEVKMPEMVIYRLNYDQIILCDFDKNTKESRLKGFGLKYGIDYLYEEDFFSELDEIQIPSDRKIAFWGTGNIAAQLQKLDLKCKADIYIDNNRKTDMFAGRKVICSDEVSNWAEYFVVIAIVKDAVIREQLESYGLTDGKDFISYQKLITMPSYMLGRTIFDKAFYDIECNTMLNHLEILNNGDTRCCCTTFVQENLHNVFEKKAEDLWQSNIHKIMCLSTQNRTFTFCDKTMCPLFVAKEIEQEQQLDIKYKKMSAIPKVLALGYDPSCNLACSTCRKDTHFAKGEELEKVNRITEKVQKDFIPKCEFLILAGDGEVFASPAYRSVYADENCNPKYIRLLSNGTLFTPKNWEEFIKNKSGKVMLTVSVDAASKETYESIRRNGNFDILKSNMEFASKLRKRGELSYFRLNFVVQRDNYKEMIPFVEWGKALGVDEIFFTKILNWGTYSAEEFAQISMMETDGITPKPELMEILEDPAMKSEIVDLGTIQYSHKIDKADIVENYYMWELEKRGGRLFDNM